MSREVERGSEGTDMTDIPEDVMEAAYAVADRINYVVTSPEDVRRDIAEAIMADRASRIRSCLLDKPEAVEAVVVPHGWQLVPTSCGGCGAPSTYDCYRHPDKPCYREFHNEGTRQAYASPTPLPTPADTDAAQIGVGSRDALIERLVKALEAAETYVIDGVTTAKQNLEMNAAYPARKPRYEAELQEARDIYAECQAARRAALAAAKDKP